jgi:tRNA A-37 threonylcarbamoyl transferase component Bud32
MNSDPGHPVSDAIEHAVLAILDGPLESRDASISQLIAGHPAASEEIRAWVAIATTEPVVAGTAPSTPAAVGDYRILERLGHGGMGEVFLAEHTKLGRRVALKLLRPEVVAEPEARRRFEREARLVARLDHPDICHLYESGDHEGRPFLAMQWIRGRPLTEVLRQWRERGFTSVHDVGTDAGTAEPVGRRAAIEAVVEIGRRVALALEAAHAEGLVHRDVKPGNIMVREDGGPVLVDFGLAREVAGDDSLTATRDVLGTPLYMAPEQIEPRGRQVDARTDVYSLAVTLYELLTLRPPFSGDSRSALFQSIMRGEFIRPRRVDRAIPADLSIALEHALETDPDRRYASAAEFAEDLRRILAGEAIQARSVGALRRAGRWLRRHPAGVSIAAGLIVLGAVMATYGVREATRHRVEMAQAMREGIESTRIGAHTTALEHFARAEGLGFADRELLQLARIDALQGAFRWREANAALDALPLDGPHSARVALLRGVRLIATDRVAGSALIERAMHETAEGGLRDEERAYAAAWLATDLAVVRRHLEEALQANPVHAPSLLLLVPVLIWSGQARDCLQILDRAQAWLPRHVELLARLATLILCEGPGPSRDLLASRGSELDPTSRRCIDWLIAAVSVLEEQLEALLADDIQAICSIPSKVKVAPAAEALCDMIAHGLALWQSSDLAPADSAPFALHPSILADHAGLLNPHDLPALIGSKTRREDFCRAVLQRRPDALVGLLLSMSLVTSGGGRVGNPAAALKVLDTTEPAQGPLANLPIVLRARAMERVGCLATLEYARRNSKAGAAIRARLSEVIQAALQLPKLTENELLAYLLVNANCKLPDRWNVAIQIQGEHRRRYGASWSQVWGVVQFARAVGAAEVARQTLAELVAREPNNQDAKAMLESIEQQAAPKPGK